MTDQIDLLAEVDAAAAALLKRAGANGEEKISLAAHTEAFLAVAKWAETRHKMQPPPVKDTKASDKFGQLKGRLNPAPRRLNGSADKPKRGKAIESEPDAEHVGNA
jgi:hypothetical protein